MFMTRKKYNSDICTAFMAGYSLGKSFEQLSKLTPNEIRKALGLKPISMAFVGEYIHEKRMERRQYRK